MSPTVPMPKSFSLWSELTEHSQGLSRLAAGLLSDFHGGEDLAQEAVLRAISKGSDPSEIQSGAAWLRTTVRRLAANEWRSKARRREREAQVARPDTVPSSEEVLVRAEIGRRVLDAVDRLPAEYARALRDHYVGGLTVAQIAERDRVSTHTVKSRIWRGKALLRESLERDRADLTEHWSMALAPLALPALRASSLAAAKGAASKSLATVVSLTAIMKKFVVTAALLLVGVAGLQWWSAQPAMADRTAEKPTENLQLKAPVDSVGARDEAPADARADRSRQAAITAPEPKGSTAPVTQVHGQVVDAAGAPLAGVTVTWSGYVWASRERRLKRAATCVTDEEGRYVAQLDYEPGSTWEASFTGQPYYTVASMTSNASESADLPVMKPGEVKAPLITLSPAGAARGRVVDGVGRPVGDVLVRVAPGKSGSSYGLMPEAETRSQEDGTFYLRHAPLGVLGVAISSDGMTTAYLEAVKFEREWTAELGDIALQASPHIRGRLVDGEGQAVPDQRVRAGSIESQGVGVSATTDMNGAFDLELKSDVPHRLSVSREGYLPLGAIGFEKITAEPGTENLELQLQALPTVNLLVVGPDSQPIESFGFRVILNGGAQSPSRVSSSARARRASDRPGGFAQLLARPGVDLLRVAAPGFLPFEGDVELDPGSLPQQTVRLQRGAVIQGRVLLDGEPVEGASVTAMGAGSRRRLARASDATDAEGRYRLRGLKSGTWELSAVGAEPSLTASLEVRIERFEGSSDAPQIDRADLSLVGGGSIEGTVLLPAGVTAMGLHAFIGDWGSARLFPVNADGSFRIPDVPQGRHEVSVTSRPGELDDVPHAPVQVHTGEASVIQVDATQHGVARVNLRMEVMGYQADEVSVVIKHGLLDSSRPNEWFNGALPRLDADGRSVIWARASGIAHLELHLTGTSYTSMALMEPELLLTPGATLDLDVTVLMGTVQVELPEDLKIEPGVYASLLLLKPGLKKPLARWGLTVEEAQPSRFATLISSGSCSLEDVPTGRMELQLLVQGATPKPLYSRTVPVTVESGATTRVRFPSALSAPPAKVR